MNISSSLQFNFMVRFVPDNTYYAIGRLNNAGASQLVARWLL